MRNDYFIFVIDSSPYKKMYLQMLSDVNDMKNVLIISEKSERKGIKHYLLHKRIRNIIGNKLDFLGYERSLLYKTIKSASSRYKNIYVVFLNSSFLLHQYMPLTLKQYKRKFPSLRYILFYIDVIESAVSYNANVLREEKVFDLVYSFSEEQASQINAISWNTLYSKTEINNYKPVVDVYFCGASKQRLKTLLEIGKYAIQHQVSISMDIICKEDEIGNNSTDDNIRLRHSNEFLDYQEVITNEIKASCILEIVDNTQVSISLRAYEAICYNRKLLTNCKGVFSSPYYNSNYIQYFDNPSTIDWDWVKKDVIVDYKYRNDFSPKGLLEDIENRFSKS